MSSCLLQTGRPGKKTAIRILTYPFSKQLLRLRKPRRSKHTVCGFLEQSRASDFSSMEHHRRWTSAVLLVPTRFFLSHYHLHFPAATYSQRANFKTKEAAIYISIDSRYVLFAQEVRSQDQNVKWTMQQSQSVVERQIWIEMIYLVPFCTFPLWSSAKG